MKNDQEFSRSIWEREKEDIPEKECNMITNKSLGHVSSFEDWMQSWGQELWWMTSQDAEADSGPS